MVYAFYDSHDAWHSAVRDLFDNEPGDLILPTTVIPELDYLIGKRLGQQARMAFLDDLIAGVYTAQQLPLELLEDIRELELRYGDLNLGFVDASVIMNSEMVAMRADCNARPSSFRWDCSRVRVGAAADREALMRLAADAPNV